MLTNLPGGEAASAAGTPRLPPRSPSPRLSLRGDWPYLLIAAGVLLLTGYRAATTGITYDEAETYLRFVEQERRPDAGALAGFLSVKSANNHPLNTFLIGITTALFPYRELAVRLPNLVACVVYLWLAISVSRRFASRPVVFGLLALNYYLSEFFGLARGYGLSAALVLAALSAWPGGARDEGGLRLSLWLLLLASLANYVAVAMLLAFLLEALLARGAPFVTRSLRSFGGLAGGLLLLWILYALAVVSQAGQLPFGDPARRFWDPVVGSCLRMFVPEWQPPPALLACLGAAFVALLLPTLIGRPRDFQRARCLVLLLAIVATASHLLGRPMPTGRVLLPFWPLAALAIGELVDLHTLRLVGRRPGLAGPSRIAGPLLLCGLVANFVRQADPTATRDWRENYARAEAVRGALERGDCLRRRYLGRHPVTEFYIKRAGKERTDPSLDCAR